MTENPDTRGRRTFREDGTMMPAANYIDEYGYERANHISTHRGRRVLVIDFFDGEAERGDWDHPNAVEPLLRRVDRIATTSSVDQHKDAWVTVDFTVAENENLRNAHMGASSIAFRKRGQGWGVDSLRLHLPPAIVSSDGTERDQTIEFANLVASVGVPTAEARSYVLIRDPPHQPVPLPHVVFGSGTTREHGVGVESRCIPPAPVLDFIAGMARLAEDAPDPSTHEP